MTDPIREFVAASHGDFEAVQRLYAEKPDLLEVPYEWSPGNTETPLQAASHVGNSQIAEFLLEKGAKWLIVTAAMLGDEGKFRQLLEENPERIHEKGAHFIPLMSHAAIGGNLAIMEKIYQAVGGADLESALVAAIGFGQPTVARWCLEKGAPATGKDWRGRTVLEMAVEGDEQDLVALLHQKIGEANLEACPHCGAKGYKYLAKVEGNPMGEHQKHFACKQCGEEWEVR